MFKRKGGGGVKGFLKNVKKTALFLFDGFPYEVKDGYDDQRILLGPNIVVRFTLRHLMVLSLELATAYCICFESSLIFEFLICILHLRFAIASNTCILNLYWFHILVGRPTDGCLGCGTFEGQAASLEKARSESTRISMFKFCICISILLLHLYYFHILVGRPVNGEVLVLRRKVQN